MKRGLWLGALAVAVASVARGDDVPARRFRAEQVFDLRQPVLFHDDFASGQFGRWNFSEDDRYGLAAATPERMAVVDAPGRPGHKAVRFVVPRAPAGSFGLTGLPVGEHSRPGLPVSRRPV